MCRNCCNSSADVHAAGNATATFNTISNDAATATAAASLFKSLALKWLSWQWREECMCCGWCAKT